MLVFFIIVGLAERLEVVEMTVEGLPHGVHVMVPEAKLPTGLLQYGSDEGVVGLDHSREEVVGGLVVQGSSEHTPEPAVRGIVLRGRHLHLRPVRVRACAYVRMCVCVRMCVRVCVRACVKFHNSPVFMEHLIFRVWFGPLHLHYIVITSLVFL